LHRRHSDASAAPEKISRRLAQDFVRLANLCSANAVQKFFAQNVSRERRKPPESIKNERISAK